VRRLSFYVPGHSRLHVMHPSTKLVLYTLIFVLTYALAWQLRWVIAGVVFGGLWLCGVSPAKYRLVLIVTAIATLTVPLFNGLWPDPTDPLVLTLWGDFGFHRRGLENGLAFSGLYSAIGILTLAVLTTTRTWDLAEAPTMLGVHHAVGFALAYTFRYMPEVATRYLDLADVWRTRGVSFSQGWPWERFWLQCRLLAALLILEFSQVRAKSNAVEARGFSLKQRATYFILPPVPSSDRAWMALATAATGLVVIVSLVNFIVSRSA
jgi:energy-coupling factor transport system permease protein